MKAVASCRSVVSAASYQDHPLARCALEVACCLCDRLADVAALSATSQSTHVALAVAVGGGGSAMDVDICCSVLAVAKTLGSADAVAGSSAEANSWVAGVPTRRRKLPLCAAAQAGRPDVVRFLLGFGNARFSRRPPPTEVDAQDADGAASLHYAALEGQVHVCSVLLQAGATVDLPDGRGVRPLHLAAEGGHASTVVALIGSRADPNLRDGEGNTALHLATEASCALTCSVLTAAGANPWSTNHQGLSAVKVAQESNNRALLDALLQRRPAEKAFEMARCLDPMALPSAAAALPAAPTPMRRGAAATALAQLLPRTLVAH
eukprot:TRINITY_DN26051_c0_g1_i1.p1 TRINITY_DN26051_c0_g1~~TRINITY_DN26051_c0_g1_i1.p1  ORF type:complete len:321 (-),score=59.84 TRINITY_DN26051_c0_g1_i1:88-1050(-)